MDLKQGDLEKRIVGQPEALAALQEMADEILARSEFQTDDARPVSAIMPGSTGVGKTLLAQTVADVLYNGNLTKLDMSEYSEMHAVSNLIGAPPGYVGYDDAGGSLCDQVRKNPYSVILFDEIEKAHPNVRNLLLQILEDGHLTDSHGRVVDFSKCLALATSNFQQLAIRDQLYQHRVQGGHQDPEIAALQLKTAVIELMTQEDPNSDCEPFKPEQMGRFPFVLPFNPLLKSDVPAILDTQLAEYNRAHQLESRGLKVQMTPAAQERLIELAGAQTLKPEPATDGSYKIELGFTNKLKSEVKTGSDETAVLQSGARNVRSLFDGVRRQVNKHLLQNKDTLKPGTLTVDVQDGKYVIEHQPDKVKHKPLNLSA